jgi:CheY-like chemotaxis protein
MSNLLIVDDEQSYRQLLTLVFEGDGHYIRTAVNGREALTMLQEEPADVIISDVKMPDMNGVCLGRNRARRFQARRGRLYSKAFRCRRIKDYRQKSARQAGFNHGKPRL